MLEEEDFFIELVIHCKEAEAASRGTFLEQAYRTIDKALAEQKQKVRKLYNPYRNLCLNKCYGESKTQLIEWMNFSKYEEE